jgi:hypothetical protein
MLRQGKFVAELEDAEVQVQTFMQHFYERLC